jgi:putative transposase
MSRFTVTPIEKTIETHDSRRKAEGIAFCKWKQRFGGMEAFEVKFLKELEEENARFGKMCANLSLVHEPLKEAVISPICLK